MGLTPTPKFGVGVDSGHLREYNGGGRRYLMKKVLVFGIFWLVFQFYGAASPELLEAQGVGLRCDTPRCNYQRFDRGGHWIGDGRHDPSPYGYGGYAPDILFGQDGINILNPGPGTTLKIVKKSGGLICLGGLLSIFGCGEETVDFSTAPRSNPTPTPVPAQQPPPPAPPIKEEILP